MLSLWSDSTRLPSFSRLEKNVKTDVLIIGGGIAGILCAYMLENAGVDYVLAEAQTICSGITKNTTAKITAQHGLIYDKLIKEFGTEKAALYLKANQQAVAKYGELCGNIDCDFEIKENYVYTTKAPDKIEKEMKALEQLEYNAVYKNNLPLPVNALCAVGFENQAQFNPLKFIGAISQKLKIYEHTNIYAVEGNTAVSDCGKIKADKIIIASHFPFINRYGGYFLKMYQQRAYVLALANAENVSAMYVDEDSKGYSFRSSGDLLLFGGAGHRTGKNGGGWNELSEKAGLYYPNANTRYRWAAQDCMTLDGVPYIGNYSMLTPNLFAATGFNKWGMTSSMVAALLLTDMLLDKYNEFSQLFSPLRTVLRPQLVLNIAESAVNLLSPKVRRCPHLGCALSWNTQEHTWDCPCHGSRFTKCGDLIDNPAVRSSKSVSKRANRHLK